MIARRIIRVLITPTRTQYWIDQGKQIGAEYELLRAFDDWLNKKYRAKRHVNIYLVFIPLSRDALIPGLLASRGDRRQEFSRSRPSAWPRWTPAARSTGASRNWSSRGRSRRW
jgi:membrane-bound lytic murein transglycosylase MltF